MKRKMQKLLSLLLILCIICSLAIPANVMSAEIKAESVGYAYGDFYYNLDANGNAIITKYVGDDTDVVIPSTIKTYNVTEINQGVFKDNTSITSVTIDENLININANVFYGCTSLESVRLPISLQVIGDYAFYGCDKLNEIEISSNVRSIGEKAVGFTAEGDIYKDFQIIGYEHTLAYKYAVNNNLIFKDKSSELSYIEIANADDLFNFAKRVNSGETDINAKLVSNIIISKDRVWSPIGIEDYKYNGVFDGQNYIISGLCINSSEVEYIGLFAYTDEDSLIKNVAINGFDLNFRLELSTCFGSICGFNYGTLINCCTTSSVNISDYCNYGDSKSAMLCGVNKGNILKCYNNADFKLLAGICYDNYGYIAESFNSGRCDPYAAYNAAGICYNNYGVINNCYNSGNIIWSGVACGICYNNENLILNTCNLGKLDGFYKEPGYVAEICEKSTGQEVNCYSKYHYKWVDVYINGEYEYSYFEEQTDPGTHSGKFAYLLSQGCTVNVVKYDGSVWGQDLSIENSHPEFCDKKVYAGYTSTSCDGEYTYLNEDILCSEKAEHIKETKIENEKPVTCVSRGYYDKVIYCTVCNTEFSRHTVILEKLTHDSKVTVKEEITPVTCLTNGRYDMVTYCTECNVELSRQSYYINATGHNWVKSRVVYPNCVNEGYTVYMCSNCSRYKKDYYTDVTPHNYVNGQCTACDALLESEHNYQNNTDESWIINCHGASSVTLTFSELTSTEANWDFIYLYDINEKEVGKYSGAELADKSVTVKGDTVKIRLKADDNDTDYGFKLTAIIPTYSTIVGDANGDNMVNVIDATNIQKHSVGATLLDERQLNRSDVNGDGVVNIIDATLIQKFAVGLISEF